MLQDHENQRLAATYRSSNTNSKSARGPVYGMENEDPSVRSFRTIVEPGPYKGILGTMWFIVREEGVQTVGTTATVPVTPSKQAPSRTQGFGSRQRTRKGQGVYGLWRGWRIGFWGLVGVWGAAAMGGGGGEF